MSHNIAKVSLEVCNKLRKPFALTYSGVNGILHFESLIVDGTIAVEPQENLTTVVDVRAGGSIRSTISSRTIIRVVYTAYLEQNEQTVGDVGVHCFQPLLVIT